MAAASRKPVMHLALPSRIGMVRTDSDDSAPATPGPHTPLPYEFGGFFNPIASVSLDEAEAEAGSSIGVGTKRGRDEEDEKRIEADWTDEEVDVIHSTLLHPFRPVSAPYPPGQLPPAHIIDELTNQIVNYAFKTRSPHSIHNQTSSPCEGDGEDHDQDQWRPSSWTRSFDATRKKVFEIALARSRFGHDAEERKMSREERQQQQHRPGLRRVDSMDFLDQAEGAEKPVDSIGKALRLSTCLQNSAKQEPLLLSLSRSTSVGSGLSIEPLCAGPSLPAAPAAITLTPASPTGPSQPPLRRKSSFRSSGSKPLRPSSLLQRGRSFTAEDLRAEAEAEDIGSSSKSGPISTCSQTILNDTPVTSPLSLTTRPLPLVHTTSARLTRSQSSSSTLDPQPHAIRDAFLSTPIPSTTDRSVLAMPLPIESSQSSSTAAKSASSKTSSGWSDSEDEAPSQPRKIKKLRQTTKTAAAAPISAGVGAGLRAPALSADAESMLAAGGLRSPFEEKDQPTFA
ncbi:hypothetical protein I316_04160 [Kwoniella heveanensis BCC8398]|uniref:Uncharacterized protein n=1 Tax=Kwoniella heveanensis BCC8398 TaxID=1296120 RepID=A0A1B9GT14_9TREE|nr:hypothetical protein I316_04160 [Kwoniella heveanensis BCC8398]